MHKITLVCSVHRANGLCSAEELLEILRAIGPEVVFEEVRPGDFDAYCKTKGSLEVEALTRYAESKPLLHVPVDRYDDKDATVGLHAMMESIFGYVEQTSQAYQDVMDERDRLARQQGFKYLNSVPFEKTSEKIEEIEDAVIRRAGNPDVIRGLQWWREAMKRRDAEMIGNIYEYCRDHAFDTGVFLVGAAHKASIVNAIRARESSDAGLIDWSFTSAGPD